MIEIKEINSNEEFNSFINEQGEEVRIVKLSAPWCGPCKVLGTTIKNLDNDKLNGVLFAEIDIDSSDECEEIASNLGVRNIPTMLFYKDKEIKERTVGAITASKIYETINSL